MDPMDTDTDAETIKNDLLRQANEDKNPLARAVYNHKFLHEKEQDQVDKGLVKRKCEIPKAWERVVKGRPLSGKQNQGRDNPFAGIDLARLSMEIAERALHVDCLTFVQVCRLIDKERLRVRRLIEPNAVEVPVLSRRTYINFLKEQKWRAITNPSYKPPRRIIARRNMLNFVSLASVLKAAYNKGVDAYFMFNIDSSSAIISLDAKGELAIVTEAAERQLRSQKLSVSISSSSKKSEASIGGPPIATKSRGVQYHVITNAAGDLVAIIHEIGDECMKNNEFRVWKLASRTPYAQYVLMRPPVHRYLKKSAASVLVHQTVLPALRMYKEDILDETGKEADELFHGVLDDESSIPLTLEPSTQESAPPQTAPSPSTQESAPQASPSSRSVLLVDGEFFQLFALSEVPDSENIEVIKLPAATSFILQPNDKAPCFRIIKGKIHSKDFKNNKLVPSTEPRFMKKLRALFESIRMDSASIATYLQYFRQIGMILDVAFERSKVQSGWLETGIYPFDVQKIYSQCPLFSDHYFTANEMELFVSAIPELAVEAGFRGKVSDKSMIRAIKSIYLGDKEDTRDYDNVPLHYDRCVSIKRYLATAMAQNASSSSSSSSPSSSSSSLPNLSSSNVAPNTALPAKKSNALSLAAITTFSSAKNLPIRKNVPIKDAEFAFAYLV